MSDAFVAGSVVISFAVFVTAHVSIAAGLARRSPPWRAAVGLVALPLAPYFAARERMWVRTAAWGLGLVGYVVGRIAAALP